MSRKSCLINFFGGSTDVYAHSYFSQFPRESPRGYGVEIVLFEEKIKDFYQQLQGKIAILTELRLRPWGAYDFRISDPFGYYLRFSEPYDNLLQSA